MERVEPDCSGPEDAIMTSAQPPVEFPNVPARTDYGCPREVRVLLVIAIVLGIAGLLFGGFGFISQLGQTQERAVETARKASEWTSKLSGDAASPQARRVQDEWIRAMVTQQWKLRPLQIVMTACNALLSAALLVGALRTRRGHEAGRRLLRTAAWAHLPYQVLVMIHGVAHSLLTATLKREYIERLSASTTGAAKDMVATVTNLGHYLGIAAVLAMGLGLSAFYVVLAVQANKPAVRAFCVASS
jgi:hypothetical protein